MSITAHSLIEDLYISKVNIKSSSPMNILSLLTPVIQWHLFVVKIKFFLNSKVRLSSKASAVTEYV